jgi:hypothetical protein
MSVLITREDLEDRIKDQLKFSENSKTVALLWTGYLMGLFEWGLISPELYGELDSLIPSVGRKELYELCIGEKTDLDLD